MNKNQKIQKFLTWTFFVAACFIFQAWAQDPANESRQPIETNASTILTKDNSTKAVRSFGVTAPAATFTVNDTGDASDANTADGVCATSTNVCTLRAAVQQANATASDDTINFAIPPGDAGCTAGGVCTITLTNGELFVFTSSSAPGSLTITNATGASNLLISGNNASRVFLVSSANLTLNGVTITNGNGTGTTSTPFNGFGGGIAQLGGTLTLNNSRVSGNSSASRGGGIYSQSGAAVTLINSTVSGNSAANGGGIDSAVSSNTLTLTNSTVSGNPAQSGGGINNFGALTLTSSTVSDNTAQLGSGGGISNNGGGATATVTNSTISGNTAQSNGGGIQSGGTLTLTNSTVSGNTATGNGIGGISNIGTLNLNSVTVTNNRSTSTTCTFCAGGISNGSGTVNLNNTIVAGNTANASASPDFSGAISSTSSFNIIGNNQGTSGITNGTNGNQVGTPTNPIDPRLEPLANNGGTTQTHALRSDSPAIDKGSSFGLTTDQRGFTRPVDLAAYSNASDGADIGTFERQPAIVTAASVTIGGRVTTASGHGISRAVIILTDLNGNSVSTVTNSSGFYRFNDVAAGATYIVSARSKRYRFIQSSQAVNATEDLAEVNFIAAGY